MPNNLFNETRKQGRCSPKEGIPHEQRNKTELAEVAVLMRILLSWF
jgi:hypothetical protein